MKALPAKPLNRVQKTLGTLAALLALLALMTFTPLTSASAHDVLVNTQPSEGSTLEKLPDEIVFTFSNEIWSEAGSAAVEVLDPNGNKLGQGEPQIDGVTLIQKLIPEQETSGLITVNWRVTSSDSHPISGTLTFTVEAPQNTPSPAASEASPLSSANPTPQNSIYEVPGEIGPFSVSPWLATILILGLVVVMIIPMVLIWRRTPKPGSNSADNNGPKPDPEDH